MEIVEMMKVIDKMILNMIRMYKLKFKVEMMKGTNRMVEDSNMEH